MANYYGFMYSPDTGVLRRKYKDTWILVGSKDKQGYLIASFENVLKKVHRVIWEIVNGPIPTGMFVDHINGIRDDNRLVNLRLATPAENRRNQKITARNTSGYKGVCWHKLAGKWSSRITVDYLGIHLGLFDTAKAAHDAYVVAAKKYHKEFARAA